MKSSPDLENPSQKKQKIKNQQEAGDYPVFVMGAERSGTSTIAAFLNSKLGYAGNSEGHIFNLLSKILKEIRNHFSLNGFSILEKPKQDSGNKDERTTAQAISQSIIISETITLWGKLVRNQMKAYGLIKHLTRNS